MGYPNGAWPDSELVIVQGSGDNAIRLNRATAAVFFAMRNDYAEETHRNLTLVNSYRGAAGYRSKATQLDMRAHPGLYSITPGIIPGLPSGHGDADCMDFDQGLAWVKANGARYGVTFPLAFDHNHGRYDGITLAGTGTQLGGTMPLDANDQAWLNGLGTEIINRITAAVPAAVWATDLKDTTGVHGTASAWLTNLPTQVKAATESIGTANGPSADQLVAALKPLFDALPAAVRAAIIK